VASVTACSLCAGDHEEIDCPIGQRVLFEEAHRTPPMWRIKVHEAMVAPWWRRRNR
jgi:hypothetical protein